MLAPIEFTHSYQGQPTVPRTFAPRRSTRFRQWKHVPLNFDTNTVKHVWRNHDMTEGSVTDGRDELNLRCGDNENSELLTGNNGTR